MKVSQLMSRLSGMDPKAEVVFYDLGLSTIDFVIEGYLADDFGEAYHDKEELEDGQEVLPCVLLKTAM